MSIAASFVMHLYCRYAPESEQSLTKPTPFDQPSDFDARHRECPYEPFGVMTFGQAKRAAQRMGWVFGRDGDVTCPVCVRFGPGTEHPTPEQLAKAKRKAS